MCTISGLVYLKSLAYPEDLEKILKVIVAGDVRGKDATGVSIIYRDRESKSFRSSKRASEIESEIREFLESNWDMSISAILANNRAQPLTEGSSDNRLNIQPIEKGRVLCIHNGTISNDAELRAKYNFTQLTQIDSEVLIDMYRRSTLSLLSDSFIEALGEIAGGFAAAIADIDLKQIYLVRNFKPLVICHHARKGVLAFSSEKDILEAGFGKEDLRAEEKYYELPCFTGLCLNLDEHDSITEFTFQSKHISNLQPADESKALVICSGGLDSVTAAYYAKIRDNRDVTLLHFDYKHSAEEKEWKCIQKIAEVGGFRLKRVDLSWLGKLGQSPLTDSSIALPQEEIAQETTMCWVPARNFVMVAVAFALAEAERFKWIYSGWNLFESGAYPDNEITFLKELNKISDYATLTRPKIVTVLERMMKEDILKLGKELGVDYSLTWSCDLSDEHPCGRCGCCTSRIHGFLKAGLEDTQVYQKNPKFAVWVTDEMKAKIKKSFLNWEDR